MEETKLVELMVTKSRQMFPKGSAFNEDGEYAIISFEVDEIIEGEPHIDKVWKTILVKGNMPTIKFGKSYHLMAQERYDEKYKNYSYEVSYIGERISVMEDIEDIRFALEEVTSKELAKRIVELDNIKQILKDGDKEALKQVNGIGDKMCIKIMDKYQEKVKFGMFLIKLSRLGLTDKMLQPLVAKYSNYETIYNKIKENPYMLADGVKGIGFIKADALAQKFDVPQNGVERIRAYVKYYLNEKSMEGKSFVTTKEVLSALRSQTDETQYPIARETITETFEKMRYKNELWWNDNKSVLAMPFVRETEEKIAEHLIRLMTSDVKYDTTTLEPTIKAIEKRKGFLYTSEQRDGITRVMESPVVVVTGLAGTGKTTVLEPMTQILVEQQQKSLIQCALAGKASQRMQEVTGYPANTVHSTLEYNPKTITVDNPTGFVRNSENPLQADVIIWDEFSMADAKLVVSFLEAVPTGTKICFVGDYGQLQCIGFGDVLLDLINSGIVPVVKLTQIHRQAQASAIITESIKVRNLEHIVGHEEEGYKILGELEDLEVDVTTDRDRLQKKVIKYFKRMLEEEDDNIMEVQVVVATRTRGDLSTFAINNLIKNIVNPTDEDEWEFAECQVDQNHKYKITAGDKIIITKNNRKALIWSDALGDFSQGMVCNGNMGIVQKIYSGYMDVEVAGVGLVRIESKDYNTVELSYACTCHKLQGSQANQVIVAVDSGAWMMLCCEWLYTALTRAGKKCALIGETKAIRRCCSVADGNSKQTFLPSFLTEIKEKIEEIKEKYRDLTKSEEIEEEEIVRMCSNRKNIKTKGYIIKSLLKINRKLVDK